jgi:hypothetical protein
LTLVPNQTRQPRIRNPRDRESPDSTNRENALVATFGDDLRIAHRFLGNTNFKSTTKVHEEQLYAFAKGYFADGKSPALDLSVDGVLENKRNVWLPRDLITITGRGKFFAASIRGARNEDEAKLSAHVKLWAAEKHAFKDLLRRELSSHGPILWRRICAAVRRAARAWAIDDDGEELLNSTLSEPYEYWIYLSHCLKALGTSEDDLCAKMHAFLHWEGLEHMPINRMQSYMFAALARKAQSGTKHFTRGMLNDVRAVSAYAPYVDALFLDNQCAALLNENPLAADLGISAKVFSLNSGDAFIGHLEEIEQSMPDCIRAAVLQCYGGAG